MLLILGFFSQFKHIHMHINIKNQQIYIFFLIWHYMFKNLILNKKKIYSLNNFYFKNISFDNLLLQSFIHFCRVRYFVSGFPLGHGLPFYLEGINC